MENNDNKMGAAHLSPQQNSIDLPKNPVDDLVNDDKEYIISQIKGRILSEYNKHKKLDWSEIAARKIYATFDISRKTEK
jgi:hypothetical protein